MEAPDLTLGGRPPSPIILGPDETAALAVLLSGLTHHIQTEGRPPAERSALWPVAHGIYQARRFRNRLFRGKYSSDVAWDVMLAAYCFHEDDPQLTVSGLCYASNRRYSTALRWVDRLIHDDVLRRYSSSKDQRMLHVTLTSIALREIELYLSAVRERFLGPVLNAKQS